MTVSDEDGLDDFPEMTPAQREYVLWAMSSDVDTGGFCDCGHEGLGPSWHGGDCRGANHALTRKVGELMERATSAEAALRVMVREAATLSEMADRSPAGFQRLLDQFVKSRGEILRLEDEVESLHAEAQAIGSTLANRLEAERPKPTSAEFSKGWLGAVDTLRRMAGLDERA